VPICLGAKRLNGVAFAIETNLCFPSGQIELTHSFHMQNHLRNCNAWPATVKFNALEQLCSI